MFSFVQGPPTETIIDPVAETHIILKLHNHAHMMYALRPVRRPWKFTTVRGEWSSMYSSPARATFMSRDGGFYVAKTV
jgi:hypothetical protein